ncbi:hypothetical protein D3C71_1592390 [compost metagenome]
MNAALLTGANNPERCRSAATTCAICAPSSLLDWKSVIAIGNGWTLPLLMLISTAACAGAENVIAIPAIAIMIPMRERLIILLKPFSYLIL